MTDFLSAKVNVIVSQMWLNRAIADTSHKMSFCDTDTRQSQAANMTSAVGTKPTSRGVCC
jgi:hypothetical protein